MVKCLPTMRETWVQSLGQEYPLEKEMATHSGTLAWKIPWTDKPGRLQSMGSQSRTRLSDFTFTFTFLLPHYRKEVSRPAILRTNFAYENISLIITKKFGILEHITHSSCLALYKHISASNSDVQDCWTSLRLRHMNLCLVTILASHPELCTQSR